MFGLQAFLGEGREGGGVGEGDGAGSVGWKVVDECLCDSGCGLAGDWFAVLLEFDWAYALRPHLCSPLRLGGGKVESRLLIIFLVCLVCLFVACLVCLF